MKQSPWLPDIPKKSAKIIEKKRERERGKKKQYFISPSLGQAQAVSGHQEYALPTHFPIKKKKKFSSVLISCLLEEGEREIG